MKTRGKAKGSDLTFEYAKAGEEYQDLIEDGANANGYPEEKADEIVPARGDNKVNRNGGNKRSGRVPRAGAAKGRNDKHTGDSAEFREVVQGFFEFIEELKKIGGKRPGKRPVPAEIKQARQTEEPKPHKVVKPNTEPTQDIELQPEAHGAPNTAAKIDKNPYYRYKEDGKGLYPLSKEPKEPDAYQPVPAQAQEAKARETETRRDNASVIDFNSKYPHMQPFPGATLPSSYNSVPVKPHQQQIASKAQQQQQHQAPNIYPGYDFPNMSIDILQRIRMQQNIDKNPLGPYFMPSQPYGKGFMDPFMSNNELLNQQLLELLQKPLGPASVHGAASLFDNLPTGFGMMNTLELAGRGQRYPNQSLGVEVMQSGPSAMNPRALEGKLGRAATHVAIAYFIYFKSLDPDTIAKSDKSKMDPTYNARMLKEKKHDPFGSDSLESYLLANMSKMNTNHPFDYLNQAATLQRLLAQQGNPDQLREAQLQRLQQELLRTEELNQIRGAYQGKADNKVEEEAQKRRANEHKEAENNRVRQQQQPKGPPKAEEIIEINENSDGEESKQPVEIAKPEQKNKPVGNVEVKPQAQQPVAQAGPVEPQKGKSEEATSADAIVEEISVLTSQGSDGGKGRKKNAVSNNNAPATEGGENGNEKKSATDEAVKVEGQAAEVQKIEDGNDRDVVVVEGNAEKGEEKIEEKMEEEKAEPKEVITVDEGEDKGQAAGQEKMTEEPKPEEKQ